MSWITSAIRRFTLRHNGIPTKRLILFESNPDFACNTYPVFLELRKRLPKYKMVWIVSHTDFIPEGVDDVIILNDRSFRRRLKATYYHFVARAAISCNRFISQFQKKQVNLYLTHGSKTKNTKGRYEPGPSVQYINVQSHFFDDVVVEGYNARKEQLVYLGYPRCDVFFNPPSISAALTKLGIGEKFLIWLPTFRKGGYVDMSDSEYCNLGMPLVYTHKRLNELDHFLAERDLHILFKPHPVQDISQLVQSNLSHIHILTDAKLAAVRLNLYDVVAHSAALISDYSSVFFDYLLLDRPIAMTTDDIEMWKEQAGFAFDLDALYNQAAFRPNTLEELYEFIQSELIDGKDSKREGRHTLCQMTNLYQDGHSAERVADFVINHIHKH